MERRFAVGTVTDGNFEADTLGNDPDLTTFDTLAEAIRDIKATPTPINDTWRPAVYDNIDRCIAWQPVVCMECSRPMSAHAPACSNFDAPEVK